MVAYGYKNYILLNSSTNDHVYTNAGIEDIMKADANGVKFITIYGSYNDPDNMNPETILLNIDNIACMRQTMQPLIEFSDDIHGMDNDTLRVTDIKDYCHRHADVIIKNYRLLDYYYESYQWRNKNPDLYKKPDNTYVYYRQMINGKLTVQRELVSPASLGNCLKLLSIDDFKNNGVKVIIGHTETDNGLYYYKLDEKTDIQSMNRAKLRDMKPVQSFDSIHKITDIIQSY